jgi:hypothetical protein
VGNKFLAALMLSGVNREKYGKLKRSLAENYVTRTSKYPKSPDVVLRILNSYTTPPGWNRCLKQEGGGRDEGCLCNRMEKTNLGRKTYCATIAGRRGISNESVQTKRPTGVENKSMQTLKSKTTPTKEKISLCKPGQKGL